MTGEISLDGVYLPTLLLLAVAALILTYGLTRVIAAMGLYRFVAYRAIVDLSLFILLLGAIAFFLPQTGIRL